MRKISSVIIGVCLIIALAACGEANENVVVTQPPVKTEDKETEKKEEAIPTVAVNEENTGDANQGHNDTQEVEDTAGQEIPDQTSEENSEVPSESGNTENNTGDVQTVDPSAKEGTNWVYKISSVKRLEDGSDYEIEIKRPYLYVTRTKKGKTIVSGVFWTEDPEILGSAEYNLGKDFMSGIVQFDGYTSMGTMSEFTEMYVTINGDTATAVDENLGLQFNFVLDETFSF